MLTHGLALFAGWSKYSTIGLTANCIGAMKRMLTFFGIVFLIYGGMHLYALSKVWLAFPHSTALGATLILAGLLLSLSPLFLFYASRQHWHGVVAVMSWPVYVWMGYILLFCVIGFAFDLGHLLMALPGFEWPLSALHLLLAVSLLALTAATYGFFEARNIGIERIDLATPKLQGKSVSIAQVSDMHLGSMLGDEFLSHVLDKLREAKPDILVATGDIVDGQGDHLNGLAQRFHDYNPPLGKFAILGNHEYYVGMEESLQFLRDAGFTVLRGDAVKVGGIVLAGVDDPAGISQGKPSHLDADAALENMPKDAFIVLLKHQPVVDTASPFDLQLSGHIHGGQIFPINYITRLVYKVDAGLTQLSGNRWLYVSRGTGTWGPPMRLLASPEITLITIKPGKLPSSIADR
jgi:uncharacterized protein